MSFSSCHAKHCGRPLHCGKRWVLGSGSLAQIQKRARCAMAQHATTEQLTVYGISDLHCDHPANMEWLRQHLNSWPAGHKSVLLVAGDISHSLATMREVLSMLKSVFWHVVFVPGNHEIWVKGPAVSKDEDQPPPDSITKLKIILEMCEELGVHVKPIRLGKLLIVPLYSWHHKSWDKEPDIPGNLVPKASALTVSDYSRCIWPGVSSDEAHGGEYIAQWLDSINDEFLSNDVSTSMHPMSQYISQLPFGNQDNTSDSGPVQVNCKTASSNSNGRQHSTSSTQNQGDLQVITLSHFLPSQQLLPEKRFLTWPNLAKAVGSDYLSQRLKQLRPALHLFGHTHFAWDAVLSDCGVRCVQAPLCYPAERQQRMRSIAVADAWQPQPNPKHAPHQAISWLPLPLAKASYSLQQRSEDNHHNNDAPSNSNTLAKLQQLPCLLAQEAQELQVQDWQLELCPRFTAMWSDHYVHHERTPNNTELAPWVAPRYARSKARQPRPAFTETGNNNDSNNQQTQTGNSVSTDGDS